MGAAGAGGAARRCPSAASSLILTCQEQSRRKADLRRIKTHLHSSSCLNYLLPHTPPTPSKPGLLPTRLRLSTQAPPLLSTPIPFPIFSRSLPFLSVPWMRICFLQSFTRNPEYGRSAKFHPLPLASFPLPFSQKSLLPPHPQPPLYRPD